MHPELQYLLIFLAMGGLVGFFAGLLGVGGGSVMVPILSMIFVARGFSNDNVIHMALATSMATIIPGAIVSAWTHHKHQAVNWDVVKRLTPGVLVGTFSGAVIAHFSSTVFLKSFFVAFICFLALQMLLNARPRAADSGALRLPGKFGLFGFGLVMGLVSSFAGIGGAVLSIAYLSWCNMRMHETIGTAAAIGVPLSIAGTIGFVLTGMSDATLPAWSLGYVYLPAMAGIALTSMLVAPYGARLAHRLPVSTLKKVFVVFLVALAIKMAVSV